MRTFTRITFQSISNLDTILPIQKTPKNLHPRTSNPKVLVINAPLIKTVRINAQKIILDPTTVHYKS